LKINNMVSKQDLEKIKNITKEFISKMTFEADVDVNQSGENAVFLNLKIDEPRILIGDGGQTLADIQHLLRMIIRRQIETPIFIDLDIQDYKKKKAEYLKELAKTAADEVSLSKKEKILEPMSSYERRVIHVELAEREGIKTESIGEGEDRRVVVKPVL